MKLLKHVFKVTQPQVNLSLINNQDNSQAYTTQQHQVGYNSANPSQNQQGIGKLLRLFLMIKIYHLL